MNGLPGAQASINAFLDRYSKSKSFSSIPNSVNFLGIPTVSERVSISLIAYAAHSSSDLPSVCKPKAFATSRNAAGTRFAFRVQLLVIT